jgi:hypothetical protein
MVRPHRLVITPWDGRNPVLLEECRQSVKASTYAEHRVVKCGPEWQRTMFRMRNDADMVAWVDGDDVVYGDAIERCFDELERSTVGVAFTDEAIIAVDGRRIRLNEGPRTLENLAAGPAGVHHLVVTRAETIDEEVLALWAKYPAVPLDWLMRARSGLRYGIKRVPMVGYGYRRHPGQMTAGTEFSRQMGRAMAPVSRVLRTWINREVFNG